MTHLVEYLSSLFSQHKVNCLLQPIILLCAIWGLWLNYTFIWNTMAEFHRILRRFSLSLPLSLLSIVLYGIIMFVHDPFFLQSNSSTAEYIHSVRCAHVRINIIYQFQMEWNGNGFGRTFFRTFHYYTSQQSYTIHNNYVYWFLYGIHSLQNALVSCKMIYICHCHMFRTRLNQ